MATGSSHAYFGHPEWAQFAPGLKTLEDAFEIRRRILLAFERAERETDPARQQELLTFVLVGGGPTGVELAGTLAEIARQTLRDDFRSHRHHSRARVILVEAGATILAGVPGKLRNAARRSLQHLGIEVMESTRVTGIDAHGVDVDAMDAEWTAGTMIWAAGVAASPLVATLGAPIDTVRSRARAAGPDDARPRRGLRRRGCRGLPSPGGRAPPRRRADGDAASCARRTNDPVTG